MASLRPHVPQVARPWSRSRPGAEGGQGHAAGPRPDQGMTRRSRLLLAPEWVVEHLNQFLRGWAAYFRFGNSAARFEKIRSYARIRMALFLAKRNRRSRGFALPGLAGKAECRR